MVLEVDPYNFVIHYCPSGIHFNADGLYNYQNDANLSTKSNTYNSFTSVTFEQEPVPQNEKVLQTNTYITSSSVENSEVQVSEVTVSDQMASNAMTKSTSNQLNQKHTSIHFLSF